MKSVMPNTEYQNVSHTLWRSDRSLRTIFSIVRLRSTSKHVNCVVGDTEFYGFVKSVNSALGQGVTLRFRHAGSYGIIHLPC